MVYKSDIIKAHLICMRKSLLSIFLVFFVFVGIFTPTGFSHAQFQSDPSVNIENAFDGVCTLGTQGDFGKCFLWLVYNVVTLLSFWLAELAGKVFDYFIHATLNTESYTNEFITKGWGIIRDIANVAFIFTLLYLAIRHILGMSAKKYIPTLLIVALLLNFSLFFTKVVIDAGNILARAFVNSINVDNDKYAEEVGYQSISVGIMQKINPQKLLNDGMFKRGVTPIQCTVSTANNECDENLAPVLDDNLTFFFFVFLLLGFINITLAGVFLSVALLFVGRIIGLWFAMIFSPIAFITLAVPGGSGMAGQFSFDKWKDNLLKLAFVAPVFLFFLYLTIMFLQIVMDTLPTNLGSSDPMIMFISVFLPFIFVVVILRTSKKVATDMAGEFGGAVKSMVGKALGVAGGLALGGAAFAGRATMGRLASARLSSGNYNAKISDVTQRAADAKKSGDTLGHARALADLKRLEMSKAFLEKMKNSTFDMRNAGQAKGIVGGVSRWAGRGLGAGMNAFGGAGMNVGAGSTQSRKKYEDEKKKEKLKYAENVSSVSYSERDRVIARQRDIVRDELLALSDQKKSIETGFENETNAITKRLDELINKQGSLTDDEVKEFEILESRQKEIPREKEQKLREVDEKIKKADIRNNEKALVEKEEKERRGFAADRVEGQDLWGTIMGVDNKEMANDIRKGKTSKSDAEKFSELAKKLAKEDEEKTKPPPATPPPATP